VRIDSVRTGGIAARTSARSPSAGVAFQVGDGSTAHRAAAAAPPAAASAIDALLAMQAVEDPTQGRKKILRRGRSLLDTLDALKTDLLLGRASDGRLNQLMAVIGQARESTDPGLDGLLDDIELRARVELAKRGLFPGL
jgi:hypothetical protein